MFGRKYQPVLRRCGQTAYHHLREFASFCPEEGSLYLLKKNKNDVKRDNRETVEMIRFFFSLLAKSGLLRTCLSQSLE